MPLRTPLLRAYQVLLLSGLLLAAGQSLHAQSVGTAPSPSASPSTSPEPSVHFADVVRVVEKDGHATTIGNYIAEDVGIKTTQLDSSPVQARALGDNQHELCVIEDTGALLFMVKNGENTTVYLANHSGALQLAGYFHPGRFRSENFKSISKEKAASAFAAEKELWIARTFPSQSHAALQPTAPAIEPHVSSQAVAKPKDKSVRNASKQTVAPKPAPSAHVDDQEKLSQMTPKEKIKYLDQQIREAKQQEKLEKKEAEKAKKNADKNSQTDPATTSDDAAPQKKKISWF